ncbi:TPA: hypothetical protein ACGO0M_000322 [Streptococcus suis]
MNYRNLKSSDRSFIYGQTNRLINQMNKNAEYLGTVQAYEAAKSRMNEAYLAMELEDDPKKKLRLAKLVEKYTAQAQTILDNWEYENRRAEKVTRNVKLILWLVSLVTVSFLFPVNILIFILFAFWLYRNYISPKRMSQLYQTVEVQSEMTDEETYEDWLTKRIVELNKDKRDWIEDILARYGDLGEVAAGQRQISEIDKEVGRKILNRYRNMLLDIEKLPDSDQKNYYLDFHQEIISDLEDIFPQLHIE